jgi:hypothetical protein
MDDFWGKDFCMNVTWLLFLIGDVDVHARALKTCRVSSIFAKFQMNRPLVFWVVHGVCARGANL